jgi:aminopeptidase N
LTAHPEAHAAMRRMVAENRDPIARALRAQQRDADA